MAEMNKKISPLDQCFMEEALRLAERGLGATSPNPMVGAVLVKGGKVIGRGWHHRAGLPHAEIEALKDADKRGCTAAGATIYVTLEPCSTEGRTPPCTRALVSSGVKRVVAGATDPNPAHRGRGFRILRRRDIEVCAGVLETQCAELNAAFNHWIIHRTPLVTVKAAMTLDGKIATTSGESKWITGDKARAFGMRLRQSADAILVGVNTITHDDPSLTWRPKRLSSKSPSHRLRRIVLDTDARIPLRAKVLTDGVAALTTVVVGKNASAGKVRALEKLARVIRAPLKAGKINLQWLLRKLGAEEVTHLLVEGGGEVNASFFQNGLVQQVCFFYAPKIFGGQKAPRAVSGHGALQWNEITSLKEVTWEWLGSDLMLRAKCERRG
jgi:diaminohydroxyphosphoribosylaminopyrimidine deaminase/5-amino-6-(5-phosphoribosylamino)uracil reductase